MVRLRRRINLRSLTATVLTVIANGSAAGAGAFLALVTIGAIQWSPVLLAFLVTTALCFSIAAEVIETPKEGPKHAAR